MTQNIFSSDRVENQDEIQQFNETLAAIPLGTLGSGIIKQRWEIDQIETFPIYKVPEFSDSVIYRMGVRLMEQIRDGQLDQLTIYRLLCLGLHVYHFPRGNRRRIFHPYLSLIWGNDVTDISSKFPVELTHAQYGEINANLELFNALEVVDRVDQENDFQFAGENEIYVKYSTFLSAYLFRFLVKDPKNLMSSWESFRKLFGNFYGLSLPENSHQPPEIWLKELRNALSYDRVVQQTWIRAIVYMEDNLELDNPHLGLIRFTSSLPLGFSGMHAYKLFHEVIGHTKQSPRWLLMEMKSPQTWKQILCISDILIRLETTEQTRRTCAFKYARILGSQFFPEIQTRQCPLFVYLLVYIIEKYEKAAGTNSNPRNIVGLDKVSSQMKQILKATAGYIIQRAPTDNKGWYSGSFSQAYAGMNVRASDSSDDDDDEPKDISALFGEED